MPIATYFNNSDMLIRCIICFSKRNNIYAPYDANYNFSLKIQIIFIYETEEKCLIKSNPFENLPQCDEDIENCFEKQVVFGYKLDQIELAEEFTLRVLARLTYSISGRRFVEKLEHVSSRIEHFWMDDFMPGI